MTEVADENTAQSLHVEETVTCDVSVKEEVVEDPSLVKQDVPVNKSSDVSETSIKNGLRANNVHDLKALDGISLFNLFATTDALPFGLFKYSCRLLPGQCAYSCFDRDEERGKKEMVAHLQDHAAHLAIKYSENATSFEAQFYSFMGSMVKNEPIDNGCTFALNEEWKGAVPTCVQLNPMKEEVAEDITLRNHVKRADASPSLILQSTNDKVIKKKRKQRQLPKAISWPELELDVVPQTGSNLVRKSVRLFKKQLKKRKLESQQEGNDSSNALELPDAPLPQIRKRRRRRRKLIPRNVSIASENITIPARCSTQSSLNANRESMSSESDDSSSESASSDCEGPYTNNITVRKILLGKKPSLVSAFRNRAARLLLQEKKRKKKMANKLDKRSIDQTSTLVRKLPEITSVTSKGVTDQSSCSSFHQNRSNGAFSKTSSSEAPITVSDDDSSTSNTLPRPSSDMTNDVTASSDSHKGPRILKRLQRCKPKKRKAEVSEAATTGDKSETSTKTRKKPRKQNLTSSVKEDIDVLSAERALLGVWNDHCYTKTGTESRFRKKIACDMFFKKIIANSLANFDQSSSESFVEYQSLDQGAATSGDRFLPSYGPCSKKTEASSDPMVKAKALRLISELRYRKPKEVMVCTVRIVNGSRSSYVVQDFYTCEICGKRFTAPNSLYGHYRGHAGIKPFKCNVCGQTFTRSHSLSYHQMIHNNTSRFKCKYCDRKFRHPTHFKEHLNRHTGQEPYKCVDCKRRFRTRNTFRRHAISKHNRVITPMGSYPVDSKVVKTITWDK